MKSLRLLLVIAALASGCAHDQTHISPEAPLGSVVIYRNGVAYFERHATVDGLLTLQVPRDRVDDFLKSLTVVDLSDGKPLAISYATPSPGSSAQVPMSIELPPGEREVRITYVTESPSWKPSYRLVLGEKETAQLQSWAVVDNVSGESWNRVKVGVGSTSALSFRYDLHSVRIVERESIDHGERLAHAPPTGGSAYAVAGQGQRVLANLSVADLNAIPSTESVAMAGAPSDGLTAVAESSASGVRRKKDVSKANDRQPGPAPYAVAGDLLNTLQSSSSRIRIEANLLPGEDSTTGLQRANDLRTRLVANGIEESRIDVSQLDKVVDDPREAFRVVALEEDANATQAKSDEADEVEDASQEGSAHFVAAEPITLEAGHSAMVTLLDEETSAQRVFVYDPKSARGSKKYAFNAVRIKNPSEHTLDAGPLTVYADGQFLGEGIADPIPPHAVALVPYALDRSVRVRQDSSTTEKINRLVAFERGVATTQSQRVRETVFEVENRGTKSATVFVRHSSTAGWTLADPPKSLEKLGDDYLVPLTVPAGHQEKLVMTETLPVTTAINLNTDGGLRSVAVYLDADDVPETLATQLQTVLDTHRRLRDLDDTLLTEHEQLVVLRERVTELNDQLVSLRKVGKAQSLSGHLAKRMKTLSNDLDTATLHVTELQADRLTARIKLSNLVADLELPDVGTR